MKILIFIAHVIFCIVIVNYTSITDSEFFNMNNQITYLGVLVGFSLTLFTFGISILKDIYSNIDNIKFNDRKNKVIVLDHIRNTFNEIKEDIKIIFYAIIAVFINEICNQTINPFGWEIEYLYLPNYFKVFIFSISTHALFDIMQALFGLAKVLLKEKDK